MIKQRHQEEFRDVLEGFLDDPEASANHMVFGMNLEQRKQARGLQGKKPLHTWR